MTSPSDPRTIAVAEIGGTSVKVGFAQGGLVAPYSRTFSTERLRQAFPVSELASILREACAEAGFSPKTVVATVPGFLAEDQDTVLNTANIPELNGLRLASLLSKELDVDVKLERDTVLQLLGESHAGAVVGAHDVLAIYFGTGIGAAYLGTDGIFRGGGWALEIGHMPVHRPDMHPTPQRVEAFASGKALAQLADHHRVKVSDLFRSDATSAVRASIDEFIWTQACIAASAVALLSPRILLLGGGVVDVGDYPRELLQERIAQVLPIISGVYALDIRWASLGWQAAIHGAMSLSDDVALAGV
ncbi:MULTISPECIES: ROK family protein [Mesorhizobium]|uniref:ROK family protein n=1 Tax=Mesorhizobium denitrificans TaxID=2294114 RepID=A0A371XI81_9HYPH|nr:MULTISPECIES: ROK family protein [Mesorhizobium]RFC68935.1 ROK family protein [Mesorhizobium denitrificans]